MIAIRANLEGATRTLAYRVLEKETREHLRLLAEQNNIQQGRNKQDTINNLIDSGKLKITVGFEIGKTA